LQWFGMGFGCLVDAWWTVFDRVDVATDVTCLVYLLSPVDSRRV
jgi:hypothetical protein